MNANECGGKKDHVQKIPDKLNERGRPLEEQGTLNFGARSFDSGNAVAQDSYPRKPSRMRTTGDSDNVPACFPLLNCGPGENPLTRHETVRSAPVLVCGSGLIWVPPNG
jgi:hypothetical protein